MPGKARTWTSFPVMRSLMNLGLPWAVPSRVTPWGTIVTEYRPKVLCLQGIRQALGVATGVFMETCLSHIYGALGIVGWLWMLSCGGRDAFFNSERPRIRARSSSYSFLYVHLSISRYLFYKIYKQHQGVSLVPVQVFQLIRLNRLMKHMSMIFF